ncbi:hypothetical protein FRC17_000346 [Serendipita sp. 399]|nr:hypothetical protein FRC17_000346 [Serendipita sp. 399]
MPANYRQALKEFAEKKRIVVSYSIEESGPEHLKSFTWTWLLKERASDPIWTPVTGEAASSKKNAEESAAKEALKVLEIWCRGAKWATDFIFLSCLLFPSEQADTPP